MNNVRSGEGLARLSLIWRARYVGQERHDYELQPDQGTRRGPDNDVEVFPSIKCCHSTTSVRWDSLAGKDTAVRETGHALVAGTSCRLATYCKQGPFCFSGDCLA